MIPPTGDSYKVCTKNFLKLFLGLGKHPKADRSQKRGYFLKTATGRSKNWEFVALLPEDVPNSPGSGKGKY